MLTLYHAPMSRSTRIVQLIEELGILDRVEIHTVGIRRRDGSGGADPENPHPEGKVPLLVHDGVEIRESVAIAQYLAELFPESGLGVAPGDPQRGLYLSWLAWYAGVLEPVLVLHLAGLETPLTRASFRALPAAQARLVAALNPAPGQPAAGREGSWLCAGRFTVADLIVASTFGWMPQAAPQDPAVQDWIARCLNRPAALAARSRDSAGRPWAPKG